LIPDDLIKRVKTLAKERGTTATALFNQFAREYVDGENRIEQIEKRVEALEKEVFKK
jgi:Mg2+ and Co2+ transporter CorA